MYVYCDRLTRYVKMQSQEGKMYSATIHLQLHLNNYISEYSKIVYYLLYRAYKHAI